MTKRVLAILVICAVCVNCDEYGPRTEYARIKRAKYYSNPPMRFYRRPPIVHPVKGIFSYTPPPNYMEHDDPYPGNFKPKVSKRPNNNGLGEEDLNNLVKHLTKQDLDKIIEFAGEKYREPSFEKFSASMNKPLLDEASDISIYKSSMQELNADQKFLLNGPYVNSNVRPNYDMDFRDNSKSPANSVMPISELDNFIFNGPLANVYNGANDPSKNMNIPSNPHYNPQFVQNSPNNLNDVSLHTEESINNNQFSAVDAYIQQELYGAASQNTDTTFTDSETLKEEQLPKPLNLREDQDYQLASTDNVPSVVKSSGYQVESFGDLPLMDYNSKRDSVSSYHVPHYTVVSPSHHPSPAASPQYIQQSSFSSSSQLVSSPAAAAIKVPKLEPAPPVSVAKEQSDAHLKATKIWTHRSKGTAYTLHDDGTLSLEKPERPRPVYSQ